MKPSWRGAGLACLLACTPLGSEPAAPHVLRRFPLEGSGLELVRGVRHGRFLPVVGRRSAAFGYEGRALEAWVYPLKLIDDFRLSFRLEGYPLDIEGSETLAAVSVRPEGAVLTYSHAAFTVRQVIFAPVDEPGIVMLLDVDGVLPMTLTGSFRPRLRLMWPAGLMTPDVEWDDEAQVYYMTEESKRFAGVVGSPGARDVSVMPYQEEPRDVPLRFHLEVPLSAMRERFVPVVVAGSVQGRQGAKDVYDRLLASAQGLYQANVAYYRDLQERTLRVDTPDDGLDRAFAWAKVGIDKGLVANPFLGTGLVAGFRTSGASERPGFAWAFGRDALWTALATTSYGDLATTRLALDFLRSYQRADGKVPHEISQSATEVPWFTEYPYPWNSADATPLYVVAHGDYWRATGDRPYLESCWPSILRAWSFTAATDTDGNGLVENTRFGHGWVEGGALHPAHEEIYMQGVWVEASRALAEMAEAVGESERAKEARAWAERTRAATEETYWLADRGFYAFATARPREKPPEAEPGPQRARRQARMEALAGGGIVDEDTVLPAVPLWWGTLDESRAQEEIDRLGGGGLATDWGQRLLSDQSRLYDPLSYHGGSVWPLFTGWTAMAAYRHGRPHVGWHALAVNVQLGFDGALGAVTELLSGDFRVPFSRSSHHQVWSQAMVATPLLRGLLGLEVSDGGRTLAFAPQLPAHWGRVALENLRAGGARYDLGLTRGGGRLSVTLTRRGGPGPGVARFVVAPAFPQDARVGGVRVDGRAARVSRRSRGDVQFAEVTAGVGPRAVRVVYEYAAGTDVVVAHALPPRGARSSGLRVLRARADGGALRSRLEGLGGRSYRLRVLTPRRPGAVPGVTVRPLGRGEWELEVSFDGPPDRYLRRDLDLSLVP